MNKYFTWEYMKYLLLGTAVAIGLLIYALWPEPKKTTIPTYKIAEPTEIPQGKVLPPCPEDYPFCKGKG